MLQPLGHVWFLLFAGALILGSFAQALFGEQIGLIMYLLLVFAGGPLLIILDMFCPPARRVLRHRFF